MAVTKRTRFEVLRRDKHTCQYCGAKAPDVKLHIDHVMPVALGGDDKPGNLVTACSGCNSGKSSIMPDSPLVEGLSEKAAAYALSMQDKMTRFRAEFEQLDEYEQEFLDLWNSWTGVSSGETVPLPGDYLRSLLAWMNMGVPMRAFEVAIAASMSAKHVRGEYGNFSYMAGVLTRMLDRQEIDLSVQSDTAAVYTESEMDALTVDAYQHGEKRGFESGVMRAELDRAINDHLRHHIDGTEMELVPGMFDKNRLVYSGKVVDRGSYSNTET